jgi:mannose-6-phosphate isomerase-like protein (cupin superfamily)
MPDAPLDLARTYVHLRPGGAAEPIAVGPDFWATLGDRFDDGWLITRFTSTEDWPHWEMHPEGDELLVMLSGRVDLQLDDGERRWTVSLHPGQTWLNRRGTWHRAIVHDPADMLFITAGKGTRHRPVSESP